MVIAAAVLIGWVGMGAVAAWWFCHTDKGDRWTLD